MTRLLGIDYGKKRVGVALSDESGTLAFPKAVLPNDHGLLDTLLGIIRSEDVEAVIFGESRDFKGKANPIMADISTFAEELGKKAGIPVNFEPEFLTSRQAEHIQGKEAATDASAAALILQSYIDKHKEL